jgi:hypothetical protein
VLVVVGSIHVDLDLRVHGLWITAPRSDKRSWRRQS